MKVTILSSEKRPRNGYFTSWDKCLESNDNFFNNVFISFHRLSAAREYMEIIPEKVSMVEREQIEPTNLKKRLTKLVKK